MSQEGSERRRPNILITGTPGVGKTTTASLLAERTGLRHINVGEVIKEHKCYEGRDEELDTSILDEDKLLDILEVMFDQAAETGEGVVADFHVCEIFPERWFDLILVLRTQTEVLFDRLTKRGYGERKRAENMECEIMQIILDEARQSYAIEAVHEVPSNTIDDMESNIERAKLWMQEWIRNNSSDEEENLDQAN